MAIFLGTIIYATNLAVAIPTALETVSVSMGNVSDAIRDTFSEKIYSVTNLVVVAIPTVLETVSVSMGNVSDAVLDTTLEQICGVTNHRRIFGKVTNRGQ
jgi:hypothetical protein